VVLNTHYWSFRQRYIDRCIKLLTPSSAEKSMQAYEHFYPMYVSLTVLQAVSRRLPKAAGRVRARVKSCGMCNGWSGTGAVCLRAL
jgi:hypothetical protein